MVHHSDGYHHRRTDRILDSSSVKDRPVEGSADFGGKDLLEKMGGKANARERAARARSVMRDEMVWS